MKCNGSHQGQQESNVSCIEFSKRCVFSAELYFWIESVCLNSVGKEFHIVGATIENERCQNVFVRSLGMHRIPWSEEECKFLLGV